MPKKKKLAVVKKAPDVPHKIYAQASPRSLGGVSLFEPDLIVDSSTVDAFASEEDLTHRAALRLRDAGFEILFISPITINIAGTPSMFSKAFNTDIIAKERPVIKQFGLETTATFLDSPLTDIPGLISTKGTDFDDLLEGIAIEVPRYLMAPNAFAPTKEYWHLDVPAGVSLGCNADLAHRSGTTGVGINVAMVDSGWYKHPFFVKRGYRVAPVVLAPGAQNPAKDEVGHGTAESANIFSVAPDAKLFPVKWNFVNSVAGFNAAVDLNPHIITCSWGSSIEDGPLEAADQAAAAAIAAAVASGIVVIFSAGNGHWGFPGQHPDVIAAGGAFMKINGSLQASDYASGFMSNIYPNRRVPDLCGLVGMQPRAAYIMLPLEPGDQIDSGSAGGTHPNGDETTQNDGWAAISGTSAAAPQLAGAAALIMQACPTLTPSDVKDILVKTARDVKTGNCNPSTGGHPATPGVDTATGHGLVDAHRSVLVAKIRCSQVPIGPIIGPKPIGPKPIGPKPIGPKPIGPKPIGPKPIGPKPIGPRPIGPKSQAEEYEDAAQYQAAMEGQALNKADAEALENLVIDSEQD